MMLRLQELAAAIYGLAEARLVLVECMGHANILLAHAGEEESDLPISPGIMQYNGARGRGTFDGFKRAGMILADDETAMIKNRTASLQGVGDICQRSLWMLFEIGCQIVTRLQERGFGLGGEEQHLPGT